MATLTFTATQAGVEEDEYALIAALRADDPAIYVMFQRGSEDDDDDWGIHFEFNDQINSAYECIKQCTLSRKRLHVELTQPIDPRKQITAVDVEITVSNAKFKAFVRMLPRIFRDREALLMVVDE